MVISHSFETLGNASILLRENGRPILATDPRLFGTCYFGSWALDNPLSAEQAAPMRQAEYYWISHWHPDHLQPPSLATLPRGAKILLPDHYSSEIAPGLRADGFDVTVLSYRAWFELFPGVRVMCMDNPNQDGILLIQAGASLIVNLHDLPWSGESGVTRRRFPLEKTHLFTLCAIDADMFDFVDASGSSLAGPPGERKCGMIWRTASLAENPGIGALCVSSSQHMYIRADSVGSNPHRIDLGDMRAHWHRPGVALAEPFVTVGLDTDASISTCPDRPLPHRRRGIEFEVPRRSLMETVTWGCFNDLLIGNFMRARLINARLYPRFTPLVSKIGGNAKVFTGPGYVPFLLRYLRRNPPGTIAALLFIELDQVVAPCRWQAAGRTGVKGPLKYIYRRMLGDPVVSDLS